MRSALPGGPARGGMGSPPRLAGFMVRDRSEVLSDVHRGSARRHAALSLRLPLRLPVALPQMVALRRMGGLDLRFRPLSRVNLPPIVAKQQTRPDPDAPQLP